MYVNNLEGFETFYQESPVCRLKWAFYCLKQAPHASYTKIKIYLTSLGFTKSDAEENLYNILLEGKLLIIVLYVDYLIVTGDEKRIRYSKEDPAREF